MSELNDSRLTEFRLRLALRDRNVAIEDQGHPVIQFSLSQSAGDPVDSEAMATHDGRLESDYQHHPKARARKMSRGACSPGSNGA